MPFANSYDELPYSCHPVQDTHPDNLACRAKLYGLRPPAVDSARILELGCGNGTNLLSLASILPNATCVGIDYAERQIEEGRAIAETVGLNNVHLLAKSFADLPHDLGQFDYILCHGVYSWVSASLQRKILETIKKHLVANGVAYVSYNIFPGWHLRGLVREMLCYQATDTGSPQDQVHRARRFLDFLISHSPESNNLYARILERERDILNRTPDTYLFHEHLEELNQPVYFHEFMACAASHGLQYLTEAGDRPEESNFTDELKADLHRMSRDRIDYEQRIDFLLNGTFRKTLLCHAGQQILSEPSQVHIRQMRIRGFSKRLEPLESLDCEQAETFEGMRGESLTTSHPLLKSALVELSEGWPNSLAFDELHAKASARLKRTDDAVERLRDVEFLAHALLRCYRSDLVELHEFEPEKPRVQSPNPLASPLARWQAGRNEPVVNRMHQVIELNEFESFVLSQLDGMNELPQLVEIIVNRVLQGEVNLYQKGEPVKDPSLIRHVVELSLAKALEKFMNGSLLVR
ncbi:bifunctional 3-demethylubiquinone-9 3-methyltransferase/ 2-octaprenyl-6-hydroxy phenol methylase [Pirellula sp. SH-Sr6A]|uniref:methyltransferase regulatory domain-containing protein n=1 Tax=Pirellula sp. SH-Sr6A TaxID=1632865 RepID=UPI00078BBB1C|nr:class I SAM-dependent methyltransferase [Pirellula sp. SH-Sr6A]AMV31401.1 bifunctional 3-demethylubiquinone-9 3-methyltransferase/ 2-octaprenyl-6-hydroxy phenol methylase [Pirellula sp. SH-Sr6A]